jgi:hypothetical protein
MAAAMLSLRERWQPVVERLAEREVLVLLPPPETTVRATLAFIGLILEATRVAMSPRPKGGYSNRRRAGTHCQSRT